MKKVIKINFLKRGAPTTLLGLALDGGRLEGVVLRRSNGSLQVNQRFTATLSLDPLTNEAELVGREILNHLEAAGVRERRCVVAVPLKWAMTAHTKLPELPEADVASFLQIEAERGFPTDVTALQIATSQVVSPSGEKQAMIVGIPKAHVERLDQVLRAAKLRPLSFSLDITALQPAEAGDANGVLALVVGESHVGLQITTGGGVVALRALEGTVETESGGRALNGELIAREARITLGQLPADLRDSVKRIRIFGPRDKAQKLMDEIRPRFEPAGMTVGLMTDYPANEFGRTIPSDASVSGAFSLAARRLVGRRDPFEFLPPRVSSWQRMTSKYAPGRLRKAGAVVAAVIALVVIAFIFQQIQIMRLRSQWTKIAPKVNELTDIQDQIRKYRPWFDDSFRYLSILRDVANAFAEDGSVMTAKTLGVRELDNRDSTDSRWMAGTLSGSADNYASIVKIQGNLRNTRGITNVVPVTRGRTPMQFTLDFQVDGFKR